MTVLISTNILFTTIEPIRMCLFISNKLVMIVNHSLTQNMMNSPSKRWVDVFRMKCVKERICDYQSIQFVLNIHEQGIRNNEQ